MFVNIVSNSWILSLQFSGFIVQYCSVCVSVSHLCMYSCMNCVADNKGLRGKVVCFFGHVFSFKFKVSRETLIKPFSFVVFAQMTFFLLRHRMFHVFRCYESQHVYRLSTVGL